MRTASLYRDWLIWSVLSRCKLSSLSQMKNSTHSWSDSLESEDSIQEPVYLSVYVCFCMHMYVCMCVHTHVCACVCSLPFLTVTLPMAALSLHRQWLQILHWGAFHNPAIKRGLSSSCHTFPTRISMSFQEESLMSVAAVTPRKCLTEYLTHIST